MNRELPPFSASIFVGGALDVFSRIQVAVDELYRLINQAATSCRRISYSCFSLSCFRPPLLNCSQYTRRFFEVF